MSSDGTDSCADHTWPYNAMATAGASQCRLTEALAWNAANGARSRATSPRIAYPEDVQLFTVKEPTALMVTKSLAYAACAQGLSSRGNASFEHVQERYSVVITCVGSAMK